MNKRTNHQLLLFLVLFSLLMTTVACPQIVTQPAGQVDTAPVADPVPTLTDLYSVTEMQAVFNAHPDTPRLILLLSPT